MNTTETEKPYPVPHTLPKAEMHVHISLALTEEAFNRRLKRRRTSLKSEFITAKEKRYYDDLTKFHATYEAMRHMTKTGQELADTTQKYLERIAREGAIYAEISNSFRDEDDFSTQVEAITAGIEAARDNTGIETRIVATTLRNTGFKHAERAANFLAKNNFTHVSGFGVVGDETVDSLADYQQAFNIAWHEAGLGLTPHVAEQDIQNAVDFLNVIPEGAGEIKQGDYRRLRVGHGTLIHTSTALMTEFYERQICMEVCLSANKRIGLPNKTKGLKVGQTVQSNLSSKSYDLDRPLAHYYNDLSQHPIQAFIGEEIPVCLGSDNPLLMNTNIGKEHSLAHKIGIHKWEEQLNFTRQAVNFANIDDITRDRLMKKINHYAHVRESGREPSQGPNGYVRAHVPSP